MESSPPVAPAPEDSWRLESLIGSRVVLGAGLIALALGAAFFLQMNHWLTPPIRVGFGMIVGTMLMLAGATRAREARTYVAEGITGLGAVVCYLSLWGGYGPFAVLSTGVALAAMIVTTTALAAIAYARKSERLALMGLAGGTFTPALLVAAQLDRGALAAYYLVLVGVMLTLAVAARYRFVEAASFLVALGTAPIFATWYVGGDVWPYQASVIVASAFFAEFALAFFIAARRDPDASWMRLSLIAADVVCYLAALRLELSEQPHAFGILALAIAGALLIAVRSSVASPRLRATYALLSLASATLALPAFVEMTGVGIVFAFEATALIAFGTLRAEKGLRFAGFALMTIAIATAWVYDGTLAASVPFLNERFAVFGALAIALGISGSIVRSHAPILDDDEHLFGLTMDIVAHGIAFWIGTTEILGAAAWGSTWIETAISLFWTLYGAALVTSGFMFRQPALRYGGLGLLAATIVKLVCIDLAMVSLEARVISFLAIGVLLVTIAALYQRSSRRRLTESS